MWMGRERSITGKIPRALIAIVFVVQMKLCRYVAKTFSSSSHH